MSVYAGPEIISDSLVFAFDMANTQKSWKGAPTTNLILDPLDYSTGNWFRTNCTVIKNSEIAPDGTLTANTVTASSLDPYLMQSLTVTSGVTYNGSLYIKGSPNSIGKKGYVWWWIAGTATGTNTFSSTFTLTGEWQAITIPPFIPTGSGTVFYRIEPADASLSPASAAGDVYYIWGAQAEASSISTPFVNGTRTTTQAILDLTGNNTITTNSLTYASNNTFSFNGTSNYLRPTISHSYLLPSSIEVIFNSTLHGTGYKTIAGYRHNDGYSLPTLGSIYLNGNTLSASLIGVTDVYRTVTSSVSIAQNTNYHVVFNKDTVNGVMQLYVNGVLTGSQTFTAANYAQWTTLGSYIGANILDIGKSSSTNAGQGWSADYFNGTIYGLKVYNKVLTAAEVKQNFNAIRSRYGI